MAPYCNFTIVTVTFRRGYSRLFLSVRYHFENRFVLSTLSKRESSERPVANNLSPKRKIATFIRDTCFLLRTYYHTPKTSSPSRIFFWFFFFPRRVLGLRKRMPILHMLEMRLITHAASFPFADRIVLWKFDYWRQSRNISRQLAVWRPLSSRGIIFETKIGTQPISRKFCCSRNVTKRPGKIRIFWPKSSEISMNQRT